jgi:hypothetical protein
MNRRAFPRTAMAKGLNLLGLMFHGAGLLLSAQTDDPGLPPLPPSPVAQFRTWLSMDASDRDTALADKPEPARRVLLAKLAEYDAMNPAQRETRLRATELHYYVRPLLHVPSAERAGRLSQLPEEFQPLATEHLAQWDALDAATRAELLTNAWAIRHFVRLETGTDAEESALHRQVPPPQRAQFESELARWKSLPPRVRLEISRAFRQFFELPSAKQQRTLETLPEFERRQIAATLQAFARLAPAQRQICLDSFRKFAGLTPDERADFLQGAERWKDMTADDRALWRRVVTQLPPLPPLQGSRPVPPMPPPRVSQLPPMPGHTPGTNP